MKTINTNEEPNAEAGIRCCATFKKPKIYHIDLELKHPYLTNTVVYDKVNIVENIIEIDGFTYFKLFKSKFARKIKTSLIISMKKIKATNLNTAYKIE